MAKSVIRAAVGGVGVDIRQRQRAKDLRGLERKYRDGDETAPSQAIYLCFRDKVPVPEWAQEGYLRYGPIGPKLKHQPTWLTQKHSFEIWWRVQELRKQTPRPPDIFGIVAAEFDTRACSTLN